MPRGIRLVLIILLGLIIGLLYGWVINPVIYVNASPQFLGRDYQTDVILMVAETYSSTREIGTAILIISSFSDLQPLDAAQAAFAYADEHSYADTDLIFIQELIRALEAQLLVIKP